MTAVVFAGPTIAADEVKAVIEAKVLPPAGQGDIYRAARKKPSAIGLIDGYFEGVPSVWHKEILWAMERGIAVFGSASMGALRAAELSVFGMIGVGRIFESYESGRLSDDDEVAVLHSPEELGFKPLSEPMVSIRATAEHAVCEGLLAPNEAAQLLNAAKAFYYKDRNWDRILAEFKGSHWHGAFSDWLPSGHIDAKRQDACEMLVQMSAFLTGDARDEEPQRHRVERTLAWQCLASRVDAERTGTNEDARGLLDELRLNPARYAGFRTKAALRVLALQEAEGTAKRIERTALLDQMARHRAARGLAQSRDLQHWLRENGLDGAGYEELLRDTLSMEEVVSALGDQLEPQILAELRYAGAYAGLQERAVEKEKRLQKLDAASGNLPGADKLQVLIWYFETLLGRDVPSNLESHAKTLGLAGVEEFYALITREFMYHQSCINQPAAGKME
ncbi:TfuA-like protein [Leisingera sp. ANG-Vp]|uniref:TfuA-like protein n=1 Tax=Leisingera sp. ANG-Vp TaxID=1577896 RepID=UPI00057EFF54|nr:TfuA-like protein [Leisingera sp. ANG-Vp]KIC21427.1 hypothetical protein RA20_04645 [Leisingera sp. ANG-Vp]